MHNALRASRLEPTSALVAAIEQLPVGHRPRVLASASGTDVYEGRDRDPAGETTPPANTFLSHLCLDWEAEANRAEHIGLRVVLLRTSLVIAAGAPALRLLALPFGLFLGGRIGSGGQWVSWIDIDDATNLICHAIDDETLLGPLNLAAPDPRPQREFAFALGRALKRPAVFPTPAWAVRLALGEQAILALGSRRVWPAKALESGYRFRHPSLEASLEQRLSRA